MSEKYNRKSMNLFIHKILDDGEQKQKKLHQQLIFSPNMLHCSFIRYYVATITSKSIKYNINPIRGATHILYGEDTFILSRMIHALGVIVYCCGTDSTSYQLAKEVLDFIWNIRYQYHIKKKNVELVQEETDTNAVAVRRSVLSAMMHSLNALPPQVLVEDVGVVVIEQYMNWLIHEYKEDPDEECREIASTNISILKSKLK
jgi:hypothetical protein